MPPVHVSTHPLVAHHVCTLRNPATQPSEFRRVVRQLTTLVAVEAFELTNGFGLLANVFDAGDLLANAAGIGFAVLVDVLTWRRSMEA